MRPKETSAGNQIPRHRPAFVDTLLPSLRLLQKYHRYEAVGLNHVPKGPSIMVINHGLWPLHAFLFAATCVERLHIYSRGVMASFLFQLPLLRDFLLAFGVVNASRENIRQLLKRGACVLVAPGGTQEGLMTRPGIKTLPWEDRTGFVEVALEEGVPILPSYCHGMEKAYWNIPFLLNQRLHFLKKTQIPIPFFLGLGPIPFPVKLTHHIAKPIVVKKERGESRRDRINRGHHGVFKSINQLISVRDHKTME